MFLISHAIFCFLLLLSSQDLVGISPCHTKDPRLGIMQSLDSYRWTVSTNNSSLVKPGPKTRVSESTIPDVGL